MTLLSHALVITALASAPVRADPGVRVGTRGGIEVGDATDPYAGIDLRLSFARTPLTINPTFDYVFDAKRTQYELSVNAVYAVPVPVALVEPYVGVGFDVTVFAYREETPGVDGHGDRLGMNLLAGACFDTPVVAPFVQIVKQIGEIDPLVFGGGVVIALDGDRRWTGCGSHTR